MKENYLKPQDIKCQKWCFGISEHLNCEGSPARLDDTDVAMVSGFNPVLMKAILNCEDFNPMEVMIKSLEDIDVNVTGSARRIRVT